MPKDILYAGGGELNPSRYLSPAGLAKRVGEHGKSSPMTEKCGCVILHYNKLQIMSIVKI